jgi:hypothetical protein
MKFIFYAFCIVNFGFIAEIESLVPEGVKVIVDGKTPPVIVAVALSAKIAF